MNEIAAVILGLGNGADNGPDCGVTGRPDCGTACIFVPRTGRDFGVGDG